MFTRRHMLQSALGTGAALGTVALLPAWARPASAGNTGLTELVGSQFDLQPDKINSYVHDHDHVFVFSHGVIFKTSNTINWPCVRILTAS